MSLQVWLPLNGNLYNQGLENVSISNSGMTYTDGKITNKAGYFASGKYASINTKTCHLIFLYLFG